MKKIVLTITAGAFLFASCENAPKADNAETAEAQTVEQANGTEYAANTEESTIQWTGTKPVGKHVGTLKLQNGVLLISENNIKGGTFVIDVKSLEPHDQDAEGNAKLQGHLLSEDFFQSEQYPTSTFEITEVKEGVPQTDDLVMKDATHMITGNLTLKNVTKSITFPAKVQVEGNKVVADADFNIDRTKWEMNYGNDQSLGDKFIRPEVNLGLHLVAEKQQM